MTNSLAVQIIPVGDDGEDLECGPCTATMFRHQSDWDKHALAIKWNTKERVFYVEFKGKGQIDVRLAALLSTKVPLRIARSSMCECGSHLQLGDYTISTENSDFAFCGEFFCPACSSRFAAEKRGMKNLLQQWFGTLKRVEIGTSGIGIERA